MSDLGALVRRADPDRYLTAIFAPSARRAALFALYAFNHELARAREVATEPGLVLIRLQWWREVVLGERRAHEVAGPLLAALANGVLESADLLAMIEARELEAEPDIPTLAAWRGWLLQGAGSVCVAAGRALGAPEAAHARLRALGAGYGVAGMVRSVGALARQGRCLLPADVLCAHGLTVDDVITDPTAARLLPVLEALAAEGRGLLGPAASCGAGWVSAALPAVLARRDLRRVGQEVRPRLMGDRIAVMLGAVGRRA